MHHHWAMGWGVCVSVSYQPGSPQLFNSLHNLHMSNKTDSSPYEGEECKFLNYPHDIVLCSFVSWPGPASRATWSCHIIDIQCQWVSIKSFPQEVTCQDKHMLQRRRANFFTIWKYKNQNYSKQEFSRLVEFFIRKYDTERVQSVKGNIISSIFNNKDNEVWSGDISNECGQS